MVKIAISCYFISRYCRNCAEHIVTRKIYILTLAAVFVTACVFDHLIHRLALGNLYLETQNVWRPYADMQFLPMYASQLLFAIFFVFLFSRNYEHKGYMEGVRFGTYIGLLLAAVDLMTYTFLPIPFVLTLSWMCASLLKCILCGLVTAVVYND